MKNYLLTDLSIYKDYKIENLEECISNINSKNINIFGELYNEESINNFEISLKNIILHIRNINIIDNKIYGDVGFIKTEYKDFIDMNDIFGTLKFNIRAACIVDNENMVINFRKIIAWDLDLNLETYLNLHPLIINLWLSGNPIKKQLAINLWKLNI